MHAVPDLEPGKFHEHPSEPVAIWISQPDASGRHVVAIRPIHGSTEPASHGWAWVTVELFVGRAASPEQAWALGLEWTPVALRHIERCRESMREIEGFMGDEVAS